MIRSSLERGADVVTSGAADLAPLVDPRWGDAGDDAASPQRRSLLSIAGTFLVEISLPKLLFAVSALLLLPALLLGIAPLAVSAWLTTVSRQLLQLTEFGAALGAIILIALATLAWRPLLRLAEVNFWSLNALAVQPGYVLCREGLRHIAERMLNPTSTPAKQARIQAVSSAVAGVMLCAAALLVAALAWPASRWTGTVTDLLFPHRLMVPTLANAIVLISAYMASASLVWGFADANMDQPLELSAFERAPAAGGSWRVAHLSDLHLVGERYGFRIESGRAGPRGNDPVQRLMERLEAIHRADPLDVVLVCGDLTDAGLATEWAEFLDVLTRHPALTARMLVVPGNHDLNIVDRANPARLDLPLSIGKRLRQVRTLSAMAAVQGDRVRVVDSATRQLTRTLNEALAPHRDRIAAFMERGGVRRAWQLRGLFDEQFPMILPPASEQGLGIAVLNSNDEAHFSFTNALGMISLEQARRLAAALDAYPRARWIIALHHHLIEYPMRGVAFSERIGTALVNGSWFVRKLTPFAARAVVMHGHRHIDWIGACGALKIVSAPSPVIGESLEAPTYFRVHTLAAGPGAQLCLLPPERVEIDTRSRVTSA